MKRPPPLGVPVSHLPVQYDFSWTPVHRDYYKPQRDHYYVSASFWTPGTLNSYHQHPGKMRNQSVRCQFTNTQNMRVARRNLHSGSESGAEYKWELNLLKSWDIVIDDWLLFNLEIRFVNIGSWCIRLNRSFKRTLVCETLKRAIKSWIWGSVINCCGPISQIITFILM